MIIVDSTEKENNNSAIVSDSDKDIESEKKTTPEEKISGKSDRILLVSILLIVVILGVFLSIKYIHKPRIITIDELNKKNIEGKLNPEEGYLYKGVYSFVKSADLWFFQLRSPSGKSEYNIPLHYGPKEIQDLKPRGRLSSLFTNTTEIYITFDPLAPELQYTALAVGELDQSLVTAFAKLPIASCNKNETSACSNRPIVTCDNTKHTPVIYFRYNETTEIIYIENCIIVQGKGMEQVRAVDRMLLQWYGVME